MHKKFNTYQYQDQYVLLLFPRHWHYSNANLNENLEKILSTVVEMGYIPALKLCTPNTYQ